MLRFICFDSEFENESPEMRPPTSPPTPPPPYLQAFDLASVREVACKIHQLNSQVRHAVLSSAVEHRRQLRMQEILLSLAPPIALLTPPHPPPPPPWYRPAHTAP